MIDNTLDGSGKRLEKFRKYMGKTQKEFAEMLNTSHGHISGMENDKKNITDTTIELLELKCNINVDWLRTGVGGDENMLKKEFLEDEYMAYATEIGNGASDRIKKAIIKYGRLSPENKKIIDDALELLTEMLKEE